MSHSNLRTVANSFYKNGYWINAIKRATDSIGAAAWRGLETILCKGCRHKNGCPNQH